MDCERSCHSFESLRGVVSAPTMAAIESFGFSTMTEIQTLALPPLLEGKDLRGTAKTGSGKTLAFLVPAVELLHKLNFQPSDGTGVLVLSPTRELAMQTHEVAQQLLEEHNKNASSSHLTCSVVTGGTDKAMEAKLLRKGASILVATPGRLLDHLRSTDQFCLQRLVCLVLDEADKMLEKQFENAMMSILNILPKDRQTMLFSATKTPKTNKLVAVALKPDFVDVNVSAKKKAVTVDTLKQAYVVCPSEKKFLFLYNIIKSFEKKKKMMVFFSTCDAVKFYHELLKYIQVDVLCIHRKQEQTLRTKSFKKFASASAATLLCTDVAARGWDIPGVDYVLQFDPPHDPSEYIHRVGRTARGDRSGEALLVLREEELPFVRCLQKRRARLTEQVLNVDKLPDEQQKVESIVEGIPFLNWWGKKAWKACIESYIMHTRKDIFNIYTLDVKKLGKSFGFSHPPKVDIAFEFKIGNEKKLLKRIREGYYADPYERSDKTATVVDGSSIGSEKDGKRPDEQNLQEEVMVNGVMGEEDNGKKKKKKKSKKRSLDDTDVLEETENETKKKSKKRKVDGDCEVDSNGNAESGDRLLDSADSGKKKQKKRKSESSEILVPGDVNSELELNNGNKKHKKKKQKIYESDSNSDQREVEEKLSQKKKKRKNKCESDAEQQSKQDEDDDQMTKGTEKCNSLGEHLPNGHITEGTVSEDKKKKKKRSKEHAMTEDSLHQDTSCSDHSSSNKKLKKPREDEQCVIQSGQNSSEAIDEISTENVEHYKKKHKKSKRYSENSARSSDTN